MAAQITTESTGLYGGPVQAATESSGLYEGPAPHRRSSTQTRSNGPPAGSTTVNLQRPHPQYDPLLFRSTSLGYPAVGGGTSHRTLRSGAATSLSASSAPSESRSHATAPIGPAATAGPAGPVGTSQPSPFATTRGPSQSLRRQPTRRSSIDSDSSLSSMSSSDESTLPAPAPTVPSAKRKALADDCPICWDSFADGDELLWCKTTCGNNFHKACFVNWLKTPKPQRAAADLRCPFCRGPWDASELRQLHIDNGIVPPRPHKRFRPDYNSRSALLESARRARINRLMLAQNRPSHLGFPAHYYLMPGQQAAGHVHPPSEASHQPQAERLPSLSTSFANGSQPGFPQPGSVDPLWPSAGVWFPHPYISPPPTTRGWMMNPAFSQQTASSFQSGPFHTSSNMTIPTAPPSASAAGLLPQPQRSHDLTSTGFRGPPFQFQMTPSFPPSPMTAAPQAPPMGPWSQPHQLHRCLAMQQQLRGSAPAPGLAGGPSMGSGASRVCPALTSTSIEVQIHQHLYQQMFFSYSGNQTS